MVGALVWPAEVGEPVAPGMNLGSARFERRSDVEKGFTLVELEFDRLDCRLRCVLRVGRNDRDRLSFVTNLVLGEQWLVGGYSERLEVPVDVLGDVLVRDDAADAGQGRRLARVQSNDACGMAGRAQRAGPEMSVWDANVVDKDRLPDDVAEAVVAWYASAYGLHAGAPFIATSGSFGSG